MTLRQSLVLGSLITVIIWWSTGWVGKITASCTLLAVFLLVGQAPAKTVFSFPLSDNFLLIIFCYLFSRGIENACIAEKTVQPATLSLCCNPIRMVAVVIVFFAATIYIIPAASGSAGYFGKHRPGTPKKDGMCPKRRSLCCCFPCSCFM